MFIKWNFVYLCEDFLPNRDSNKKHDSELNYTEHHSALELFWSKTEHVFIDLERKKEMIGLTEKRIIYPTSAQVRHMAPERKRWQRGRRSLHENGATCKRFHFKNSFKSMITTTLC